ncbi:MAG TPA: CmpA/NrtA family ABC transporter substrate-binding protein [Nitrospira sp.]|jgi:nitrate/nitrite transport system substrate-binding protein|nr:CmpA/NrtA family ABC transporter substrate-binding protein [Nitrospira sp.]
MSDQEPAGVNSSEQHLERTLDQAVTAAVLEAAGPTRRQLLVGLGAATLSALIAETFPLARLKAFAADPVGKPEKPDVSIAFIPITCGTPIIMAEPLGFYKKHGLNASVKRAAGWAMIRDWAVNKEVDAAHMLTPMPLAITLGAGSVPTPIYMPAVENINGQAITLHIKHKAVKTAADMKGFRFCVPFDYSMHNYLLRYFLAEGGVHPDKDVQIRVVPPAEMVANLKAGNVDGYLGPDPFNQRAVYENAGFIFKLSKDIWDRHPCCAFTVTKEFATTNPNTFLAMWRAIVDATHYASDPAHRKEIAAAIAPTNYLNQPVTVLEQVLTGTYADGLGNIKKDPNRIDFDPYPWHSMAIWILTQMKRWGHLKGDVNYKTVAEQVYRAADCDRIEKELGYATHQATAVKHVIMGKEFDPNNADAYAKSFKIHSMA